MRGIVIGKFYPPHRGHNYLIDTAQAQCQSVDVLVVDNPSYKISSQLRSNWLRASHPDANIQIIPDIYDDDNSEAWGQHTMDFLGYQPDVVFSSEPYGKTWANAMGCTYVDVDIERATVPISGTKVRQDILASWQYLSEPVRSGLAIRIVVIGAESTGTTTLSRDLARSLSAPWVPEIGRSYTESILPAGYEWENEDFHRIGRLQQAYENEIAARSNGIVVCDTNATATVVWQRRYMGQSDKTMHDIAAADTVDLYIITGDDIPFVQDGTRDGEHIRHDMHQWFIQYIQKTGVPYIVVTGSRQSRLTEATKAARRSIKAARKIE